MKTDLKYKEFRRLLLNRGEYHFSFVLSGSFFELPMKYFVSNPTDFDVMFCRKDLVASYENVSPVSKNQGRKHLNKIELRIDTRDCHIGFSRLRQGKASDINKTTGLEFYRKQESWIFCRSTGPCDAVNYSVNALTGETIIGLNVLSLFDKCWTRRDIIKADIVYCVRCPTWPSVANEWRTRKRENGWPPNDVIDEIVSRGCHLVSKPHQSNPNDDTMWRFSFSQAEVILIHHWTPVQKYIYHILRLIKSEVVEACGEEKETVINTYFFKTLMLWACEQRPQEFWKENNIESAVGELLCLTIEWLIEKRLPNYFIPDNNMIDYLTDDDDLSIEILLIISLKAHNLAAFLTNPVDKCLEENIYFLVPKSLTEYAVIRVMNTYFSEASDVDMHIILSELIDFLPELRFLFNGITTHKHLTMGSLENSTDRIQVGLALKYFELAIQKKGDSDLSALSFNFDDSPTETFLRLKSFIIENHSARANTSKANEYIRNLTRSSAGILEPTITNLLDFVAQTCESPAYLICMAYFANFVYTVLKDFRLALAFCRKVLSYFGSYPICNIPLLADSFFMPISSEWSALFDKHIQTVAGFVMLFSAKRKHGATVIYITPLFFLNYLAFQCSRNLSSEPVVTFQCMNFERVDGKHNLTEPDEPAKIFLMSTVVASGIKPNDCEEHLLAHSK